VLNNLDIKMFIMLHRMMEARSVTRTGQRLGQAAPGVIVELRTTDCGDAQNWLRNQIAIACDA